MKSYLRYLIILFISATQTTLAKTFRVLSPDKKNKIEINVDRNIRWSVAHLNEVLLTNNVVNLTLADGKVLGKDPSVLKVQTQTGNSVITATVPTKNKIIPDNFNELKIYFKGNYALIFRAYNDGIAYRFEISLPEPSIQILNEGVEFNFKDDCETFLPQEKNPEMQSHYEADFKRVKLSEIAPSQYGYLPLHMSTKSGLKMVVTEADLHDYPNLFLFGTGKASMKGDFPRVILQNKLADHSDRTEVILKKAPYIAATKGTRTFPWRTIIISPDDKKLLENDLVYKLSSPNRLKNTTWIKPGKVAWDWWNANNIYGVDFKSGINTETYKYYIDFAAEYGLEYIILDEGWTKNTTDLLHTNPDLDLRELIDYGAKKNVGIILWCLWQPLDRDMNKILDEYRRWGAKGIKVDFMARADQYMVNFYERTAAACAERQLLVDFHGAYKPVGLNRTYPNIINYEGVRGLENDKWEESVTPEHDVQLPFTRMVAGPMDYTPGAMLNGDKKSFHISFNEPMSMGTRTHQVAMYVCYDAPLQMLADNPSNYRRDPECTRFISRIPTVWDQTIGLSGTAGEHLVVARKNGEKWFIGAMTNWDARIVQIPLNFLDPGIKYRIDICQDGVNADKHAADYKLISQETSSKETLTIQMASGGGYAAILTPVK